jgi:hypothetical protein
VRDAIFSVGARNESRVLSLMSALPVNAGTSASPMCMLSRCSEHPLNVPIDSPHHADARALASRGLRRRRSGNRSLSAIPRYRYPGQPSAGLSCSRPASRRVTNSRPRGGRIGSSKKAGPGGSGLGSCDQLSAFRDVLRARLAFFSAASIAALSEQIVVLS